jgi:esterase/lipase superfamily enzyme
MRREYYKWHSPRLDRTMETLVFGHTGMPVLVFPTSCGRFFDFEDRGMIDAIHQKIERGELQLFCVDSVDAESWYNQSISPAERIARQVKYERYIMDEVLPLVHQLNPAPQLSAIGCSLGGYHAANVALRHPDVFSAFLSMGGAFDMSPFLDGYSDNDVYYHSPLSFMSNMCDPGMLDRFRRNTYILATGVHDQCWNDNERLAAVLRSKGIAARLDVWGENTGHDWPFWQRMVQTYL